MATGYLRNSACGMDFRIGGMNGNAATGNINPLHTGLDALEAHRQSGDNRHGCDPANKPKTKQTPSRIVIRL